jgi:hypothetical protein
MKGNPTQIIRLKILKTNRSKQDAVHNYQISLNGYHLVNMNMVYLINNQDHIHLS